MELVKRDYEVTMVVINDDAAKRCRERFGNVNTVCLNLTMDRSSKARFFTYIKYAFKASRTLSNVKSDFYFGHHLAAALAVAMSRVNGKKICGIDDFWSLYWKQSHPSFPFNLFSMVLNHYERVVFKKADIVLSTSEYLRQEFIHQGSKESQTFAVGIGADQKIFTKVKHNDNFRTLYGIKNDEFYLIYQGKIQQHDGVQHLIDAFTIIRKKHSKAKLFIVGSGDYLDQLKIKAAEKGLKNSIIFPGWVSQDDLAILMSSALINVIPFPDVPATRGVLPYKLTEAMMLGIPTVVRDLPGVRELTQDGKTCVLYASDDTEALVNAIELLIVNPHLRKTMIKAGKIQAKKMTWQQFGSTVVDLVMLKR